VTQGHWKECYLIERTYEFLLVFHSNYVPILHRFWAIASCWSKIANLNLTQLYSVPP